MADLMGGDTKDDGGSVLSGCLVHEVLAIGGGAQIGVDIGIHGETESDLVLFQLIVAVFVHPDGLEIIVIYTDPDQTVGIAKHIGDMVNDVLEIGRGEVVVIRLGSSQRRLI